MPLTPLNGPIKSVTLFKQPLTLDVPIDDYLGDTMYIKDASPDTNNAAILVITIDNEGPPTTPRFAKAAFTSATVRISYKRSPFSTATTKTPVTYGGMPLILTGTVNNLTAGKYDKVEVVPAVDEWARPERGLEYVVVQQSKDPLKPLPKENELRWFATSIEVSEVRPTVDVILNPKGGGIQGPFGMETPSP
jgi:hypothetical protein